MHAQGNHPPSTNAAIVNGLRTASELRAAGFKEHAMAVSALAFVAQQLEDRVSELQHSRDL